MNNFEKLLFMERAERMCFVTVSILRRIYYILAASCGVWSRRSGRKRACGFYCVMQSTYRCPSPSRSQFVPFQRSRTKCMPASAQQVRSTASTVSESSPCTASTGPFFAATGPDAAVSSFSPDECEIPENGWRRRGYSVLQLAPVSSSPKSSPSSALTSPLYKSLAYR